MELSADGKVVYGIRHVLTGGTVSSSFKVCVNDLREVSLSLLGLNFLKVKLR